ncbi:MAG: thioredoxin family protein [Pseudomonadota bacterium]
MRLILAATAVTFLTACGQAEVPASERAAVSVPAEDTRVLAVLSYADWCGSCKALDPKVKAVQAANEFDGVEFATIDYTSRDADAFFSDADTLGVGDAMRGQFADKIKTGRLYLVNLDSGEIISTVDKSMDEAAILAAITDAAALS